MTDAPVAPPERMPDIRVTVMAADANPYGTAFVGWLFGQMSLAGGSLASRRTGKRAPVVAADGFKFLAPADIGDAAVFLLSRASDYMHGAIIPVDGGWLAR